MADPCCNITGGEVYITLGDRRYEATGDVTIQPTTVEKEGLASSGGRHYTIERSKPARATFTLLNFCDANPMDIFNARCGFNMTVVEKSTRRRHLFTNASAVGAPEHNLQTGEVSGMEVTTDDYSVADLVV